MSSNAPDARTGAEPDAASEESSRAVVDVRSLAKGGTGGFVATAVMTAFRMPITDSLPPTANFWATYVGGGRPDDYALQGLVLHLLYGTVGGVVFSGLAGPWMEGPDVTKERRGALGGFAYGLLLSIVGVRVVLQSVLGMELDPDERWVFHVSHVVYGLTLGTWLGSRD
ncbi:hypothetical protein [Halomicrococcus gelatinilyticus]|uniref:hypothetical protein n=1 Tax=Halomicrococcus gelatinilyticus TaxID=1702103 RepID=UPI002E0F04D1